ncbi:MAG: copper transporter [Gaiellaceae bacterium]
MFGLRYHVVSLAAVFVALAVGILLGVAISGKVTDAREGLEEELLRDENARLQEDVDAARAAEEDATQRGEATQQLLARAYPALMEGRLENQSVAVLFLGPTDGSLRADVEGALADADAGAPTHVISLEVPVDGADLAAALEGDELLAAYADEDSDFSDLGRELGRELVEDGDAPLWSALSSRLVEERTGNVSAPVDSAVVVVTWMPPPEDEELDEQAAADLEATSSLMDGLVGGLDSSGIPVVGVASSGAAPEVGELYRDQGISSVDDMEDQAGRLALALLLAGAEPGHYGLGEDTDGVVPPIEPLTTEGE